MSRRRCGAGTARRGRHTAPDIESRLLPLINVVFLLLVFFLLAGRLEPASPVPATPPLAEAEGRDQPVALRLHLGPDGAMALDGVPVTREALPAALDAHRTLGGLPPVRLLADAGADAALMVALLEVLSQAGTPEAFLVTRRAP